MLYGLDVIDIHMHFPEGKTRSEVDQDYLKEFGEKKALIMSERRGKLQSRWRKMYGLPDPETVKRTPEEYAELWSREVERIGLERAVFLTGGGNDNLAEVVNLNPEKFIGFAHHSPFSEGAAEELERAITKLGLKGYKILAP